MTQLTAFKLINLFLLFFNVVVFFVPKRPMQNVTSNAAGILALIAIVIVVVFIIHLILTILAWYFNSLTLFRILAFILIPASLVFWYYTIPMIQFKG